MASIDDPPASTPAPDLRIRGDEVTLHPSGYVESPSQTARDEEKEEALMKHMARFRSEPFAFLREVSMYVSGTGWRAYDKVIGQPIFYSGFSENMKTMVLASPILQDRIKQLAEMRVAVEEKEGRFTRNGSLDNSLKSTRQRALLAQLEEVADIWLDKMICKFESKTFIRGAYYLATQLLLRAYHQGIHVSSEEVLRLHKIAEEAEKKKQSIIFLPCHKSHVDYVSMQLICYRLGLALPTVVSGDNLNFPIVGSFLQHAGAMWIRRSFGDDALYPTLVQAYIDTLLQGGFNFECFIEGGRSRTGKLLSPKFGILGFVLDSILSGRVEDAIVCPVSTQYDKVIETEGYVNELLGVPKKKENLADFLLGGSSVLSLRLGRIDVRFAEPWSLRGFINDQVSRLSKVPRGLNLDFKDPQNTKLRHKLLRTLGYKVLADINDVSVVMPTALIGTVLLTLRGRGVSASVLLHRVNWLMERVKAKGGRIAHFGNLDLKDVVRRGLEVLGKELVRVVPNETLVEETYEAVDPFQLSYYRNMTMHLFVSEALVSVSLYARVKRGGGPSIQDMPYEELYNQVQFLSSLFRGEFIFSNEGLEANLETTLKGMESDGVIRLDRNADGRVVKIGLSDGEREAQRENYDFYCFLLWPFVEAAWLAAVSLMGLTPPLGTLTDTWIPVTKAQTGAQRLGMTLFHQGDLSYIEAVNKETLKNSYQRFQEEGIVEVTRSKDPKVPAKMRLSPDWLVPRDPKTGELTMSGRLFEFIDKIACSRREGKNRRDEKTIKSRAVVYADIIGQELFLEAAAAGKTIVSPEEEMDDRQGRHRRRLEDRPKL